MRINKIGMNSKFRNQYISYALNKRQNRIPQYSQEINYLKDYQNLNTVHNDEEKAYKRDHYKYQTFDKNKSENKRNRLKNKNEGILTIRAATPLSKVKPIVRNLSEMLRFKNIKYLNYVKMNLNRRANSFTYLNSSGNSSRSKDARKVKYLRDSSFLEINSSPLFQRFVKIIPFPNDCTPLAKKSIISCKSLSFRAKNVKRNLNYQKKISLNLNQDLAHDKKTNYKEHLKTSRFISNGFEFQYSLKPISKKVYFHNLTLNYDKFRAQIPPEIILKFRQRENNLKAKNKLNKRISPFLTANQSKNTNMKKSCKVNEISPW